MQGQIRTYFELEAKDLIDRLTRGALDLSERARSAEQNPAPAGVQPLERAAHTLKGAAHVVGEPRLATLAHDFEDALADYVQTPGPEHAAVLVRLSDALAAELARAGGGARAQDAPEPAAAEVSEASVEFAADAFAADTPAVPVVERRRILEPVTVGSAFERTVRVELAQTERLLEEIGASTRLAVSLRQSLARMDLAPALDSFGALDRRELTDHLDRLDRSLAELYRVGSQLRLISSENLLLEAGRMVRASAAALGREVLCVTRGGQERVDVHVLEALEGALLHLIRNAVAHGAEPPAERRAQGKPLLASISVSLERSGSQLRLVCADDGRGIDPERVHAAAVARGLLAPGAALSGVELLQTLFLPGFSTARQTDQVSGRGIGLDAVRTAVEGLGGEVSVESTPGQGTVFTLTVPQTLAAVLALQVLAGSRHYAVPLVAIEQTFLLGVHHTTVSSGAPSQDAPGRETLLLEHETMPVFHLSDAFPAAPARGRTTAQPGQGSSAGDARSCLIVRSGRDARVRAAIAVDALAGISDVLARPLPDFTGASALVAGAVLSSAGEPVLLLDPQGLVDYALSRGGGARRVGPAETREDESHPILVVDDSLTTRMLEQSILEAEGYTVELATSAEQGLDKARQKRYALFLVDVEMPGMSGFDFVRTVQADAELRRTPSILVTSLDSAESRDRGRRAGAESYIVKGEFHQQLYLDRVRALAGPPPRSLRGGAVASSSQGAAINARVPGSGGPVR